MFFYNDMKFLHKPKVGMKIRVINTDIDAEIVSVNGWTIQYKFVINRHGSYHYPSPVNSANWIFAEYNCFEIVE